jgi:hypothetical protein
LEHTYVYCVTVDAASVYDAIEIVDEMPEEALGDAQESYWYGPEPEDVHLEEKEV